MNNIFKGINFENANEDSLFISKEEFGEYYDRVSNVMLHDINDLLN